MSARVPRGTIEASPRRCVADLTLFLGGKRLCNATAHPAFTPQKNGDKGLERPRPLLSRSFCCWPTTHGACTARKPGPCSGLVARVHNTGNPLQPSPCSHSRCSIHDCLRCRAAIPVPNTGTDPIRARRPLVASGWRGGVAPGQTRPYRVAGTATLRCDAMSNLFL